MDDIELRRITAAHEAGHAAMQMLTGLSATNVHVGPGMGLVEGSDEFGSPKDAILIWLAGPAAEVDFNYKIANLPESNSDDLREAIKLLEAHPIALRLVPQPVPGTGKLPTGGPFNMDDLPINMDDLPKFEVKLLDVETALENWFKRCCDILSKHRYLVELIQEACYDGFLSAADLQSIFDQYNNDLADGQTDSDQTDPG